MDKTPSSGCRTYFRFQLLHSDFQVSDFLYQFIDGTCHVEGYIFEVIRISRSTGHIFHRQAWSSKPCRMEPRSRYTQFRATHCMPAAQTFRAGISDTGSSAALTTSAALAMWGASAAIPTAVTNRLPSQPAVGVGPRRGSVQIVVGLPYHSLVSALSRAQAVRWFAVLQRPHPDWEPPCHGSAGSSEHPLSSRCRMRFSQN